MLQVQVKSGLEVTTQFGDTLVELVFIIIIIIIIISLPTNILKDLFLKLYETLTEVRTTFLVVLYTFDFCISSSKGVFWGFKKWLVLRTQI